MAEIKFYKQTTVPASQSPDGIYFVQASQNDPFQLYVVHAGQVLEQDVLTTALQNALALKANDNAVVKLSGNQSVAGRKTFSTVPRSSQAPSVASDLTRKDYVDNLFSGGGGSDQTLQQVLEEGDEATRAIFMDDSGPANPRYSFTQEKQTGMHSFVTSGVRYLSLTVKSKTILDLLEDQHGIIAYSDLHMARSYIHTPAEPLTSSVDETNGTSSILTISDDGHAKWILRGNFTGNRTVRINTLKRGGEVRILLVNLSTTARQFTIQASETTSGWSTCDRVEQSGYHVGGTFLVAAYNNLTHIPGAMLISVMNFNGTFVATKISD